MTIAREEIFGPVLSVLRWRDEAALLDQVNAVEYGLTCSIWTDSLTRAHRLARLVDAGFVWVNKAGPHFLGAPFGGASSPASAARNAWANCSPSPARRTCTSRSTDVSIRPDRTAGG